MKNRSLILMVIVCIFFGLFSSTPTWGGSEKVIKLKYASMVPPSHPTNKWTMQFLKDLEKASGGTVEITYYGAQALGQAKDQFETVKSGLADMVNFSCGYTPQQFPLSAFVELPLFSRSNISATKVMLALYKRGLTSDEFKDVHLCYAFVPPPSHLFSTREVAKVEDFKGMRVTGGKTAEWIQLWKNLGATGVGIPSPDVYLALQRGTIDGSILNWSASAMAWKWQEVAKYAMDLPLTGGYYSGILMNKNSWKKLSPKVQKAWTKLFDEKIWDYVNVFNGAEVEGKQMWIDAGAKIVTLSPQEEKRIAQLVTPIWTKWIERNESKGKPAKEIYKTYVKVMRELGEPIMVKIPGLYE